MAASSDSTDDIRELRRLLSQARERIDELEKENGNGSERLARW